MEMAVSTNAETGIFVETGPIIDEMYHLIKPLSSWTDWDNKSEAIHCLSREHLMEWGEEPKGVLQDIIDKLAGKLVVSDAPSYDGYWFDRLCRDIEYKTGGALGVRFGNILNLEFGDRTFDDMLWFQLQNGMEVYRKSLTHGAQEDATDLARFVIDCIAKTTFALYGKA